jgi:hypothetical protein
VVIQAFPSSPAAALALKPAAPANTQQAPEVVAALPPGPAALSQSAPTAALAPAAPESGPAPQSQPKPADGGPTGFLELARAQQRVPVSQHARHSGLGFGEDGFGLDDVLDAINPLQHLPVVSTLYRSLTGDHIDAVPNMIGGALYGGPLGFALAAVDSAIEDATGNDVGGHVMAALIGEPDDTKDSPVQVAAAGTAADAGGTTATAGPEAAPPSPRSQGPAPWYLAAAATTADTPPEIAETVETAEAADAAEKAASIAPAAGPPAAASGAASEAAANAASPSAAADASPPAVGPRPLTKAQLSLLAERDRADGTAPEPAKAASGMALSALAARGPGQLDPRSPVSDGAPGVKPAGDIPDLTPEQFALLMKSIGAEPADDSAGPTINTSTGAADSASMDAGAPQSQAQGSAAEDSENGTASTPALPPAPTAAALSRARRFTMPTRGFPAGTVVRGRTADPSIPQRMQRGLDSYMKNRTSLDPRPLTLDVVE